MRNFSAPEMFAPQSAEAIARALAPTPKISEKTINAQKQAKAPGRLCRAGRAPWRISTAMCQRNIYNQIAAGGYACSPEAAPLERANAQESR